MMDLLVLDFETYFDTDYQLRKMTTESYVRDPRFKAHMVGYFAPGAMTAPATGTAALLNNEAFRARISSSAVLVFHAHFDGLILAHHFGLRPKFWLDALPMARLLLPKLKSHSLDALAAHFGLPAKTVPYHLFKGVRDLSPELYAQVAAGCVHDLELTLAIFQRLLPSVPRDELVTIDATTRMFTEPTLVLDRPRMTKFLSAEKVRKAKAMLAAGAALHLPVHLATTPDEMRDLLTRIEAELQSSAKFQVALETLGHDCPMKYSDKAKSACKACDENGLVDGMVCSTCGGGRKVKGGLIPALAKDDDGMKALLESDDPRVAALAAARLGVKSTTDETRAQTLLDSDARGPMPVYLGYAAAKTLRWGGSDKTNFQNLRRGGEIRKSLQAPAGSKLVIGDLSQIEYRLLLWVARQWDKLHALTAGVDLYCEFASEFYGETVTRDMKEKRGVGKQSTLMGGYGSGPETQIRTAAGGGYGPPVTLTFEEGQRIVRLYRSGHPMVLAFWKWCEWAIPILGQGGTAEHPSGAFTIRDHKLWFPNGTAIDYTGMRFATNNEIFPDQEWDGDARSWWEPSRKGWSRMWGSKLTADVIQGLACVVIKRALVQVAPRYHLALQVHDELVCVVPDAQAGPVTPKPVTIAGAQEGSALHFLLETLLDPPPWAPDLPLEAEGLCSQTYDK